MSRVNRLYIYACHEDEAELFAMEAQQLFGNTGIPVKEGSGYLLSQRLIEPGRSPYLKGRLDILEEADSLEKLLDCAGGWALIEQPYKAVFIRTDDDLDYETRLQTERLIGGRLQGNADLRSPARLIGAARLSGRWLLGEYTASGADWMKHNSQPQSYSTALPVRAARALVNIAVPQPEGVRAVDPCCGIGTVLLEAMAIGVDIEGFDLNPLAVRGARANLAHFGYPDRVQVADMRGIQARYNAAILDLPYNKCSVLPDDTLKEMLEALRRMTEDCAVIVSIDDIEEAINLAGFYVEGRSTLRKGRFARRIYRCR
ncbi:TRM11 family SAM-dependent methyltransferase [Paenibacillus tarimensis]|uniref:TRM11 family SAM-dependent methyltransferase n=1 Tax=Paenibacillus tarimensis TaxID=416012 RepID=UPI001F1ECE20|nr:RNA methyltransferase [Paenibacillus tarimensis]MCF2943609.1 RNA methyltransferase [Paenibacillus tarimensis]